MRLKVTKLNYRNWILGLLAGSALVACQPEKQEADKVEAEAANQASELKEEEKMGYAIGAKMAEFIRTDLESYDLPSLDKEAISRGFVDSLNNKSKMTSEEMLVKFQEFQQVMQAAQQQRAEVERQKEKELAEKAKIEGEAFLAENAKKEGVITAESGLQYSVIHQGDEKGAKPSATDTVVAHYHGTFVDGKVFDSSVERGQPTPFPLNRVIKGWTEGLQLMTVGSKYHFVIPSDLAYGPQGRPGAIPGNSVLQFEIELISIQAKEEKAETAKE